MHTGGQLIVDQFLAEGVERVFCVPGESYLAVMDALYDAAEQIDLISCRHEGGAAMMAVASAHLSGRASVAFVTRGPGATNASIAVHIARQASIPLVLGVGQVALRNLGRESFQEVDFEAYFAPIAKQVWQIDDPSATPDAVAEAFALAQSGRMGPVVLVFPEDVSSGTTDVGAVAPIAPVFEELDGLVTAAVGDYLSKAERPLIIVGGGPWSEAARERLHTFAADRDIPVCAAFRRIDIFDNNHPCYAGFLGLSAHPALWERVERADCLLVIGARLDEPTTRGYEIPKARCADQVLIHSHPDPVQLGLNFLPDLAIPATVEKFMARLGELPPGPAPVRNHWRAAARADYLESEMPPSSSGKLDLGAVMGVLNAAIPADAIVTCDAGNFTVWPQRYRRYTRPGRLVAPINGAMGYGVPAAVAASLTYPGRTVIGCVGDGGMLMTGMELATALKYGAKPIILVFNNDSYGTIEMHQRRHYPGRQIGTDLHNPDFAAFAESFGAFGIRVTRTEDFGPALVRARTAGTAAVIELVEG